MLYKGLTICSAAIDNLEYAIDLILHSDAVHIRADFGGGGNYEIFSVFGRLNIQLMVELVLLKQF